MTKRERSRDEQRTVSRRRFLGASAVGLGAAAADLSVLTSAASAAPNPISVENALPGTTDDWNLPYVDTDIEGFPTSYSVNAGETIGFKIQTAATAYDINIYRVGWYGGAGARKVATIQPSASLPQTQPAPYTDTTTGLVDCGNWAESASWQVPANAVSGVYVANLVMTATGGSNRIMFVVRNDGRASDVLVQTSDLTYQAYNRWGGYSMYAGSSAYGRAVKVSYNRPYDPDELENEFFYAEYPLIRWLERNGYDVAYCAGLDTAARPAELLSRKVFVSSGHDEYWSGSMRTNVENARDNGVNLVFMTGNEVFWRVRWEPSPITGNNHETMVCYKETLAGAKIDPSPEWTGTWRDARFTPPAIGGDAPENGLTGTLFKAINPVDDPDFAIQVPASYGSRRFWRNTGVASLAPGTTATLSPATLGYEWNTDEPNSVRPNGLIRLSETTEIAYEVLQDEGGTYATAPLTHYVTLYRAASGAFVWSTGTNQWAWGLDDDHTNRPDVPIPTNVDMQQATLNMLADMGVQPVTRQAELSPASATTDTVPPLTTIQTPVDGASGPVGTPVIVSGTATDSGGGVVAAVEVSTDGGATWSLADGTDSWSYTFIPVQLGPTTIQVRAIDDSCNIETPGPGHTFTGLTQSFPASIFPNAVTPANPSVTDPSPLELGVRFRSNVDGFITGIRFYKGADNTGLHTGRLWSNTGALLATVDFSNETASGWQMALFSEPVAVFSDVTYVASYSAPNGGYAADNGGLTESYELDPLRALASGEDGLNGVYGIVGTYPTSFFGASNYWVDVLFDTDDGRPPALVDQSPASGVSAVDTAATVVASFSEELQPGTAQLSLDGPGGPVASTVVEDTGARTITLTPDAPLDALTQYTATVSGGIDLVGEPMSPVSWSFTTTGAPGVLPTTLWTSADVPAGPSIADPNPIELGVRFTSEVDGIVNAIRFYKGPLNTGQHVGRLWDINGNILGTATFTNESATGWQEAPLDPPVTIAKDTVHVVSYYAPNGGYAATGDQFNGVSVERGPLEAPASEAIDGNGVYRYGAGGGFPTSSYNETNYWVDLVMEGVPDTTAPIVTNMVPAPGLVAVDSSQSIVASFDGAVDTGTVSFDLQHNGSDVPATLSFPDAVTAELTPDAPLAPGTTYDASISATDLAGNAMAAPHTWSFTTDTGVGATPATLWTTATVPDVESANDSAAVEVGVKFSPDVDGSITAIRYYRGPGNDGPHVGHLWTDQGALLGSATFANETEVGWQQAAFTQPIPVSAGALYVASYQAPNGNYSYTGGALSSTIERAPLRAPSSGSSGGNGVYRYGTSSFPDQSFGAASYLVDVVFIDDGGPSVISNDPAAGTTNVALDATLSVTFSEPIVGATAQIELRDAGGGLVPVTVTQTDAATLSVEPDTPLVSAVAYTASVIDVQDSGGNGMAAPHSWSFTTIDTSLVSLFGSAVPSDPSADDPSTIEVGMKFHVTEAVDLLGIRFYRGAGNTGQQVGHIWDEAGTQLGEVTFATGGADGWQYAALASPLALTVGQTYVVSYLAPNGGYAVDSSYFDSGDVANGPLVGQANTVTSNNGVFSYGGGFPTGSFAGSNYWVDVLVQTQGGA